MQKRKYTDEFKQQALKLAEELGSVAEAAVHLGINAHTISNWRYRGLLKSAPVLSNLEVEIKKLHKENSELKKVNYILKKAAAFFSQDHIE